ncbi:MULTISPECIES: hypothetical protein [Flectobacillus]|uniref:hypothetical protein n=1 Tax=Flectobacillus TaxID=101 RepID=UPI000BA2E602|nr:MULTISPECIES: hypothetical protein [Flectobacillus]MDI9872301.1 hypothetical protein [Flectobacillus roseus]PAC28869.1 hypothetical protein BWI92_17710 [Flectobacillus sp. BAB-3569]
MTHNLDPIFEKINSIQKDIGYTNQYGFFELIKKDSESIEKQQTLPIDLIASENDDKLQNYLINQLENHGIEVTLKKIDPKPIAYPSLIANILMIFFEDSSAEAIMDILASQRNHYKKVYLVNNVNSQILIDQILDFCKINLITSQSISFQSEDDIDIFIKTIDKHKLLLLSKLSTLKPVVEYINQIVKTENRILHSQKSLLIQDTMYLKKADSNSFSEINNTVRYSILKNLQEVEKGVKIKYEEFSKPNYGYFSERIAHFINLLKYNDLNQIDVADKYEKIELGLNDNITQEFFKFNETELLKEFRKDSALLKTITQSTFDELNQLLSRFKLPKMTIEKFVLPDLNPTLMVQGNNYMQKNFRGEITKEGRNEYLIALRDYTGIIMVIVGLLMPLNLLIQGVDFFSDGEQVPKTLAEVNNVYEYLAFFAKKTKLAILLITSILSGILIWYGVIDLKVRIPRKRKEERERETQKAKDHLQSEAKRIYNDSYKDWVNNLSNYIRELTQNITFEVDTILKNATKKAQDVSNNKKQQLSNSQSIIDNKLRNLQLAEKTCESLQKSISEQKDRIII